MLLRRSLAPLLCLLVACASSTEARPLVVGKNAGKFKGRWLKVYDQEALSALPTAYVGASTVDIAWKREGKDTPIDDGQIYDSTGS